MGRQLTKNIGLTAVLGMSLALAGCPSKSEDASVATAGKKLYVASGACFSGSGITTYAQSATGNSISSYDSVSGAYNGVELAMSQVSPVDVNTTPVHVINRSSDLLVLTENASQQINRRVLKVPKASPTTYSAFLDDGDAFTNLATHIAKSFAYDSTDGSIQFSKTILVEKILPNNVRAVKGGANPWINPVAITGTCFPAIPAAPGIVGLDILSPFSTGVDGKTVMLSAGPVAGVANTNRIFAVSRTGLTSATPADCNGVTGTGISTVAHINGPGLAGPISIVAPGANPTAMVKIATSTPGTYKLIVAYSTQIVTQFDNNTNFNTGLVMWDMVETSDTLVTFLTPTIIYRNSNVVWAPSALAYDSATSSLYVAVGGAPGVINQTSSNYGYNIEKFTVNLAAVAPATVLTRIHTDNKPFFTGNQNTKCISSLAIE